MNKILLSAVAVLGFAGAALAQEAPAIYGNPDLTTTYRNEHVDTRGVAPLTNAVSTHERSVPAALPVDGGFNINMSGDYSGR